jgi:hypothetical protein
MDGNDQQAIQQLFGKLAAVERQSPPRDAASEAYIREQITAQPGAPYYMAQTIVVQEHALQAAQARIEELEAEAARTSRPSGGFFGSVFGDSRAQRSGSVPRIGRAGLAASDGPTQAAAPMHQRASGGFLAGAAQTAMGVAGGMLLANAIGGLFGADQAQATEAPQQGEDESDTGFDGGGFEELEL